MDQADDDVDPDNETNDTTRDPVTDSEGDDHGYDQDKNHRVANLVDKHRLVIDLGVIAQGVLTTLGKPRLELLRGYTFRGVSYKSGASILNG